MSVSDERNCVGLVLQNGIKVVLISDPSTTFSAAALNAGVGSVNELNHYYGVAHLVEHMLHMGSEKYPQDDAYAAFITNNGGYKNAITDYKSTIYHFSIPPKYFAEAFDIFIHAFVKPLFTESALESAIDAVHREYEENLTRDGERFSQILCNVMDKTHPLARFHAGNMLSLKNLPEEDNIKTLSLVLDFYDRMYSSNLMSLAILSRESLEELTDLIVPVVCKIPNNELKLKLVPSIPFIEGKLYRTVPVTARNVLKLLWDIPNMSREYNAMPIETLNIMISNNQEGSLTQQLKQRRWAEKVQFHLQFDIPECSIAAVEIEMTSEGIDHWKEIVYLFFQYLNLFDEGVERWRLTELQKIFQSNFDYRSNINTPEAVINIVRELPYCKIEDAFTAKVLLSDVRPDLIEQIIDFLRPELCSIFLTSEKFRKVATLKDPWYGGEYTIEYLSEDLIEKWEKYDPLEYLYLPPPNPFVPGKLELHKPSNGGVEEYPVLVINNPCVKMWYKQDNIYKRPTAYVMMTIVSPSRYSNLETAAAFEIYVHMIDSLLASIRETGKMCQCKVDIEALGTNLQVNYGGYYDKLDMLCNIVPDTLLSAYSTEEAFNSSKDAKLRAFEDVANKSPWKLAENEYGHLMRILPFKESDLIKPLKEMTYRRFLELIYDILLQVKIYAIIYGNVKEEKAIDLMNFIEQKLAKTGSKFIRSPALYPIHQTYLPAGKAYHITVKSGIHRVSAVMIRYQLLSNLVNHAYSILFISLLDQSFFNVFQTKENSSYAVSMNLSSFVHSYAITFFVQSDKNHGFVQSRILEFVDAAEQELCSLDEDAFSRQVESLIDMVLAKPKSMYEQAIAYSNELSEEKIIFDRMKLVASELRSATKDKITDFYRRYISRNAPEMRRISVFVEPEYFAKESPTDKEANGCFVIGSDEDQEILDADEWIKSMPTIPFKI